MPFKRILLLLLAFLFVAVTASATAATYNPFTQFSTVSNPNGVWTYGYGSVGIGPVTLFTQTNGQFWVDGADPIISNYNGILGGINIPAGNLLMHPGDAENLASILVFTAPFPALTPLVDCSNGTTRITVPETECRCPSARTLRTVLCTPISFLLRRTSTMRHSICQPH